MITDQCVSVTDLKKDMNAIIQDLKREKIIFVNKGYNRAYSLKRSVLQRNAIRILNYYANGAPMKLAKRK